MSQAFTIPAPFRGVNNRDGEYDLGPEYATRLVNWVPGPGYLDARGPCIALSSNTVGRVIVGIYPNASGNYIFSTDNGDFYLVTSPIGAALDTAGTDGDYHGNLFGTRTILCNAVDTPRVYDGTTFAALAVTGTGLTDSNLWGSLTFKRRVLYWEKDTRRFWYADAGAFQGPLSEFDLSSFVLGEGTLVSIATMTIDGGEGPDDLCAFLFTNGEVLVYQGDDPGSLTAWSMVGRFRIGRMNSRFCWAHLGSSTVVATEAGPVDLGKALTSGAIDESAAVSPVFGAINFTVTGASVEARLILDNFNRILWLVLLDQSAIGSAQNMRAISGMDIESRAWFDTNNIGFDDGSGSGTATAICASSTGTYIGATSSGRLLFGPNRSETGAVADFFTNGGLSYISRQQGVNAGDPARFKMVNSAAVNIVRTATSSPTESGTISVAGDRQTLVSQSVGTPSVRARVNTSAYGQRMTVESTMTSRAGLRWYSTDLWAKLVGAR